MKRVSPRRIPKTQADVDKAYLKGLHDRRLDVLDVVVYTIGCDCEMSDDWLEFFNERFMKNLRCHLFGELSTDDMRRTAYAERDWKIEEV